MHAQSVLAPMQGGTWMAQLVRPQQMTCTCTHTVCILNLRKVGSCKQDFGSIPGLWSIQNSSKPFSTGPSKFEKHSLSSLPLATSLDGFVHFRSETNRSTSSGQVLYQSYECATRVSLDNGELLHFWLILTVLLKKMKVQTCHVIKYQYNIAIFSSNQTKKIVPERGCSLCSLPHNCIPGTLSYSRRAVQPSQNGRLVLRIPSVFWQSQVRRLACDLRCAHT